jgi:hypothetical protein
MRSRLISVTLLLLLTVFSTPGTTQETGRIFCILVDDIRFLPSDVESAGRLLAVLRDEVLTDGDMVGVVSLVRLQSPPIVETLPIVPT